jgi:iron complex outermembrane receptor protein
MYTFYDGDHFATLQWVEHQESIPKGYEWVRNNGRKTDANTFIKGEFRLNERWRLYADMQYRYVLYKLKGIDDDDMLDLTQTKVWSFINPKAGLFWKMNATNTCYASVSVGHREPARADIKDALKSAHPVTIKPEQLIDYELGYTFDNQIVKTSFNLYYRIITTNGSDWKIK